MPLTHEERSRIQAQVRRCAIVGAGPAGLIAYVTLRFGGLPASDVALFDRTEAPLDLWRATAAAICQESMRSESEGHFFATDFPGFALLESVHRRSPLPLLRSVFNRYHPSLEDILRHGIGLARHYGIDQQLRVTHVARLVRHEEPIPHFGLLDDHGVLQERARHVLLAPGHGIWHWPAPLAEPDTRARFEGVLYHAYQHKTYDGRRFVVVGGGMAAVGEWVNVLKSGGSVVALHRAGELVEQPLTAPRCAFSAPWLDHYHRLDAGARAQVLAELARGTSPRPPTWKRIIDEGRRDRRLVTKVGEIRQVSRNDDSGVLVAVAVPGRGEETVLADRLIAATGFTSGWQEHGLIRRLVEEYEIATMGQHLLLEDDCTVPVISQPGSVLSVAGALSSWAYPPADSFAGMKYAARRFALHATNREWPGRPRPAAWLDMVRGGWPYGALDDRSPLCASP